MISGRGRRAVAGAETNAPFTENLLESGGAAGDPARCGREQVRQVTPGDHIKASGDGATG